MRLVSELMIVFATLVTPSYCYADLLWDQQPDTTSVASLDQQFPDFPDFSTYLVNDVTFNSDVNIESVTTYFTNSNDIWIGVTSAVLNIFDGDALTAGDDPETGGDFGIPLANVTVTALGNDLIAVTVSGLNINLTAGTYWFGLTPDADFSTFGIQTHYESVSRIGSVTHYRNPGGGYEFPAGTDWGNVDTDLAPGYKDASLTITGFPPPPPCKNSCLWDQQPDTSLTPVVDQQFPDFPDFSTYLVNDATFATHVTIESVTTYFTKRDELFLGVTQAVLNIFDGDALTADDDPATGGDYGFAQTNVTVTELGTDLLAVTATDLNINLAPGTYWFGLTPDADFLTFGTQIHHDSGSRIGSGSLYRNPGGGYGFPAGTVWGSVDPDLELGYADASMTITGSPNIPPVQILWDQQPETTLIPAVDQQFPDFPDFDIYVVNDVTFTSDVIIDSVTTYFTDGGDGTWLVVDEGVLNIFDGDDLTSGDDPTIGGDFGPGQTTVTVIDLGDNLLGVTASGLNISLTAGTYWFGLTPVANFGELDQEFHYDSGSTIGFGSLYRNPGGAFGLPAGTDWGSVDPDLAPGYGDASITITGSTDGLEVLVDDFTIVRGIQMGGQLDDLRQSDNSYLTIGSGITTSPLEPRVWIVFDGAAPSDSPTTFIVTLEARANTFGLTQTIDMFNYNSGQFEAVGAQAASFNNDSVMTVDLSTNIAEYVEFGTGAVKTRIGWRATGPILMVPWSVSIDQVIWRVTE